LVKKKRVEMEKKLDNDDLPEIQKVIYLMGSKRAFHVGHAALILVDKSGGGTFYSSQLDIKKLQADSIFNIAPFVHVKEFIKIFLGKWIPFEYYKQKLKPEEIDSYFKTGQIPLKDTNPIFRVYKGHYDKYLIIPVPSIDYGKSMVKKAEDIHKNPGLFHAFERNCNHLCQTILAEGGLNFTSHKGHPEIAKNEIRVLKKLLKRFQVIQSMTYIYVQFKKFNDMGIFPNGAYEKGVEVAKTKNYEYGTIHKNILKGEEKRINDKNLSIQTELIKQVPDERLHKDGEINHSLEKYKMVFSKNEKKYLSIHKNCQVAKIGEESAMLKKSILNREQGLEKIQVNDFKEKFLKNIQKNKIDIDFPST